MVRLHPPNTICRYNINHNNVSINYDCSRERLVNDLTFTTSTILTMELLNEAGRIWNAELAKAKILLVPQT